MWRYHRSKYYKVKVELSAFLRNGGKSFLDFEENWLLSKRTLLKSESSLEPYFARHNSDKYIFFLTQIVEQHGDAFGSI